MHVHLPKPLHGWREFAGEVGIIVLGVLIALAFEQAVESWAWHQKTGRAEAAMRLELAEDDGPQAYGRVLIWQCLDGQLARIHDGAADLPAEQLREWIHNYTPPFRTWDSEAWKTVLASEVGSHMGPDRLIQWSSPYRVLAGMSENNQKERDLTVELRDAFPPSKNPSPTDREALRHDAARLRTINISLFRASELVLARSNGLNAPVPKATKRELLKEAHVLYGDCARVPEPNVTPAAQLLVSNLRSTVFR
jgi:hypothetical protein